MIHVTQVGKMSVALSNGRHEIISDVKENLGGEDSGLDAHELIEAALGACTVLTLEMYAKRKAWDLTNLKVEVKITKEEKGMAIIERILSFGEQNTPEERERLIVIANKCPIHNLLEGTIKIETHEK